MKINVSPVFWLILGAILTLGTHMTYGIGSLAWIATVPFLIYLYLTQGWKSRLGFVLIYVLTWSLIILKIATDPLPLIFIPLFSVPIALFHLPAFLIWGHFRYRNMAWLLFPAMMTVLEWIQYSFTPLASWGAAAYTQVDHPALMQSVSLFGLAGLSFLIYWVNATITYLVIDPGKHLQKLLPPMMSLFLLLCYGALRYDLGKARGQGMVRVAAVGTNSQVGIGPMPSDELRRKNATILFNRTRKAATASPELIVWNEAAAAVLPGEEAVWKDSLKALAAECGVALVAAYVMPVSLSPLRYENKYLFIRSDGSIGATYFKHEPVPGEPAVRGTAPFVTHRVTGTDVAGVICYDYDFPYIARALGRLDADIVALPSSDWRGIDPIHTKMAAFRAVEQGHSILRSTRFGLSAAITPFGEMVAQMSSFDENDKIMQAHLPSTKVFALYRWIGDLFVYCCLGFILWSGFKVVRRTPGNLPYGQRGTDSACQ